MSTMPTDCLAVAVAPVPEPSLDEPPKPPGGKEFGSVLLPKPN